MQRMREVTKNFASHARNLGNGGLTNLIVSEERHVPPSEQDDL